MRALHRRSGRWRRDRAYLLTLMPASLILAFFFLVPSLWAIYVSLTNLALLDASARNPTFVGFDNYRRLWNDPDFPLYVKNSAVFVLGSAVIGQTLLGLALALLFRHASERGFRLAGLAFAALIVAWISPPLMTGFIWGRLLDVRDGAFNVAITDLGLAPVDFLGNHAMLSVIAVEIWRGTAFAALLFLSALVTIPHDIHDAARCDGASAIARFLDLTLPLLRPMAALVLLMATMNAAGSFLTILVLTNGDPGRQTETLALFAFHRGFQFFEIGFGSAVSAVLLVFNVICAVIALSIARERR
jgi:multiple sugar transport system permease protein